MIIPPGARSAPPGRRRRPGGLARDQGIFRPHDAADRCLMPARPAPKRHWRSYGNDPLPTGGQALDEPLRAFPSWFLRIVCERCGKERMISETHMAQGDMLIRDILERMRHDGLRRPRREGRAADRDRWLQPPGAADRAEGRRRRSGRPLTGYVAKSACRSAERCTSFVIGLPVRLPVNVKAVRCQRRVRYPGKSA
jgi:hypothetical protein